jgi:hypothetical protein
MALSSIPFEGTVATAPANVNAAAAASVQPYDNTNSVIVYNTNTTKAVLIQVRTAPVGTANDSTTTYLPPLSAITLPIGDVSNRDPFSTVNGQKTIYYTTDDAAATSSVRVTYINGPS